MKKLGCDKIIVLAGDVDEKIPYGLALDNIYNVLKSAAPVAESYGVTMLLEPLNTYDRPTYVLPYSRDAFDIVRGISSPSVKLLFDIYHTQRMEGNLIDTIEKNIDHIGHFHVANSPYRCEPDNGEIDYMAVFSAIDASAYSDYVGYEYRIRNSEFSLKKYIEEYKARG
jgi:hydroxypyruvate isomerase